MTHSPKKVLAEYLVILGLAQQADSTNPEWPISVGAADQDTTDNWITIKSAGGWNEGKLHRTGESIIKPRCQIEVRGLVHGVAEKKLIEILEALSPVHRVTIPVDTEGGTASYLLHNVHILIPAAFLMEEEKNQRQIYVATVQLSLQEQ